MYVYVKSIYVFFQNIIRSITANTIHLSLLLLFIIDCLSFIICYVSFIVYYIAIIHYSAYFLWFIIFMIYDFNAITIFWYYKHIWDIQFNFIFFSLHRIFSIFPIKIIDPSRNLTVFFEYPDWFVAFQRWGTEELGNAKISLENERRASPKLWPLAGRWFSGLTIWVDF